MTKKQIPDIQKQAISLHPFTQAIKIFKKPRGSKTPQMISPRSVDLLILGSLQGESWGWNREIFTWEGSGGDGGDGRW